MSFKTIVKTIPHLANSYCDGLQALRSSDGARVICRQTRRLRGSVNLDEALKQVCPNDPRWDYGIGWKANSGNEETIWIEFHDANSSHVNAVIQKANWLKDWLGSRAPALWTMTRTDGGLVWISTDGVSLQRNSRQAKQLAYAGVSFPQKCLHLR